jgi:hypothetical protein
MFFIEKIIVGEYLEEPLGEVETVLREELDPFAFCSWAA